MSVWTIVGTEEQPIPKPVGKAKATYCIVAMPENLIVQRGECSRSISVDLDPGQYRIVVSQLVVPGGISSPREGGTTTLLKWKKDFFHELTPEQHKRIINSPLQFTKGMQTSDGVRYLCKLTGCDVEMTSRAAAVLHEAEHKGVDLLKRHVPQDEMPVPVVNVEAEVAKIQAERAQDINRLREAALKE